MTTRRGWYGNSAGEVSTTSSSVWTNGVSKTFTPNASKNYVVFWNCLLQSTSTTVSSQVRLSDGTNTVTQNIEAQEPTTPADYRPCGGMYFFSSGASPSAMTFVIEVKSSSGSSTTVRGKNFSLTIIELDALDATASSTGRSTTTSATPSTKVTLNLTPGTTGDYLLIYTFHTDSTVGNFPDFNVRADTTVVYDNADNPGSKDTANRYPSMRLARLNWNTSAHSADIQYASPFGGTVGIEEARILALRCDVGDESSSQDLTEGGGASSTTYADAVSHTATPAAGDSLVLGALKLNSGSTTISAYAQLLEGATTLLEGVSEHTTAYCTVYHFYAQTRALANSSTTWKWQTKAESGTPDIFVDGAIALVNLDTAIRGAASITEAADTSSSAGTVSLSAAAAITEAGDTIGAAGAVAITAAASITEAGDSIGSAGTVPAAGTLAVTESGDTPSSAGTVAVAGATSITEAGDTSSAAGGVAVAGALAATEDDDAITAEGTAESVAEVSGEADIAEADDVLAAEGTAEQEPEPVATIDVAAHERAVEREKRRREREAALARLAEAVEEIEEEAPDAPAIAAAVAEAHTILAAAPDFSAERATLVDIRAAIAQLEALLSEQDDEEAAEMMLLVA